MKKVDEQVDTVQEKTAAPAAEEEDVPDSWDADSDDESSKTTSTATPDGATEAKKAAAQAERDAKKAEITKKVEQLKSSLSSIQSSISDHKKAMEEAQKKAAEETAKRAKLEEAKRKEEEEAKKKEMKKDEDSKKVSKQLSLSLPAYTSLPLSFPSCSAHRFRDLLVCSVLHCWTAQRHTEKYAVNMCNSKAQFGIFSR